MKRYYEQLAVSTRPELVQHATYPAVNWFTPYQLKYEVSKRGFHKVYDRFDFIEPRGRSAIVRAAVRAIRTLPALRFLGHVVTSYSAIIAQK